MELQLRLFKQAEQVAGMGWWSWDPQDNDLFWSDNIFRLLGLEPQSETPSMEGFFSRIHPQDMDRVMGMVARAAETKKTPPMEYRICGVDGTTRHVRAHGTAVLSEEGEVVYQVGTLLDLTETVERELALERNRVLLAKTRQAEVELQRSVLEKSNRELAQFAYVASHDLQEPLRTIKSFVGLLEREYVAHLDDNARVYMSFVTGAADRMSNLIHDLLQYSRLGAEGQAGQVNCSELLAEIQEDLGARIDETGARLEIGALPTVQGHRTLLRLLFQNLLVNAMKFTRAGIAPIISISSTPLGQGHSFTVQDNGIGIPPEHRERVMLVFQRLHSTKDFEGSGIGLAQCQKIVQVHGGSLRIADGLEHGTAIEFDIQSLES
ncbi:MAG: ATP-binding protein [Polyangiales bacterium]